MTMLKKILIILILFSVGGCISNPQIKGISAGAMFINVDLGPAGNIRQIAPIVLVNIECD